MKNVLIITSSYRKGSNSCRLAEAFAKGAADAGHRVETVDLSDKQISFCRGCMACQKLGRCVIQDDANRVTEKMLHADVIVFATPVYYYSISGQLKTMLDRANSLFTAEYAFRDIYLLATAAEDLPSTVEGARTAVQGWVDCFEKATLAGVVFAGGVDAPGDVEGHDALARAREMGTQV